MGEVISSRVISGPSFSGTFYVETKKVLGKLGHAGHPAFTVYSNLTSSSHIQ